MDSSQDSVACSGKSSRFYPKKAVDAALGDLAGIRNTIANRLGAKSKKNGDWRRLTTENHIAFVYNRRGRLLASAWNKAMTRSKGSGASAYTMHAEIAVLKKLGDLALLRDSVMVVARFTHGGRVSASDPCSACRVKLTKMFELYGLKGGGVHYSRSVH